MIAFALVLALSVQQQSAPPAPPVDTKPAPWREMPGTPDEQEGESKRDPRVTLYGYGKCVATRSRDRVTTMLSGDFRTREYAASMRLVNKVNSDCLRAGRRMTLKADGLLAAGAMAEALIESDPSPLNVRLARAAAGTSPETYSPSDAAAMCVVRSVPDDAARLFATRIASSAEKAAADALQPVMSACLRGAKAEISNDGLRAMLATAAFRSLRAASAATRS